MESYPFIILFGAKQPVKLCLLAIRTCSKQKYRHLVMRWRYVDFEIFVCFYFWNVFSISTLQQITILVSKKAKNNPVCEVNQRFTRGK